MQPTTTFQTSPFRKQQYFICFAQTLPSNQLEVAQRGPNCDAFTYEEKQWMETRMQEGPLNSHTSWQWEQEVNPKSSEFSASTELRLMAWHQVAQKPVHHASASAALQEPWGAQVAMLPELAQTQSYKCSDVILKMSQVKKKWKVVLAFCKTSGYVVRKV